MTETTNSLKVVLQVQHLVVTDFSETGITFDTSAETFDEEVSGVPVDFSTVANTFDQTTSTFDDA